MRYTTSPNDFVLPAEWEPQSGVMLTWPHADTDWKPYLRQITNTYLELAEAITRFERLLVVTPIVESTRKMLAERLSDRQMSRVHLYEIDSNDTWARDHGPITLVSRSKQNSFIIPIHLLDFKFNGWGRNLTGRRTMPSTCSCTTKGHSALHWRTTLDSYLRAAASRATAREPSSPPANVSWLPIATNHSPERT